MGGTNTPYKIIFVCEWNTCRSAMAEYIMRHLINAAGLADKIQVDSAGCTTEGGESIGRRTRQTLEDNGIKVGKHISKSFTRQHYETFDCVIALEEKILCKMKNTFGDPDNKIRLFKDANGNSINVKDPGFTGDHAKAYTKILRGCAALLKEVS